MHAELLEWYRGEIAGEAFFAALGDAAVEPEQARKWQALARLERRVAARLASALEARGVELPACTVEQRRGQDSAREIAGLRWREILERLRPELAGHVRDFETAEGGLPTELQSLARYVTDHERALLEFVDRELDSGGAGSLDRVAALLS